MWASQTAHWVRAALVQDESESALSFAFEEAKNVLARYLEAVNRLEARAATLAVFSTATLGGIVSALAGLLLHPLAGDVIRRPAIAMPFFGLFAVAIGGLTMCGVPALLSGRGGNLAVGLRPADLESIAAARSPRAAILERALPAYTAGIRYHQDPNDQMADALVAARRGLLVGIVGTLFSAGTLIIGVLFS